MNKSGLAVNRHCMGNLKSLMQRLYFISQKPKLMNYEKKSSQFIFARVSHW